MKNPFTFAYHVGSDILVNGSQIYSDIESAKTNWDSQSYEAFGQAVGNALEKILVGEVALDAEYTVFYGISASQVVQIIDGVLKGALQAENQTDLLSCLGDTERVVEELNSAYHDFKKETASGIADGLMELGHAIQDVETAVSDCASIATEWATIVEWSHNFSDPWSLAIHVGTDILVNGSQIYSDITGAVSAWDSQEYETFGEDVGNALAKIIVGQELLIMQ